MDDRQPVSLARRALSYVICYLLAVQPMLPAMAAQITPVTPGTKMDAAGNGVPVVNIATPNGAGISHNQYQQYNVGKEGLILNNATGQLTQTQLGGLVQNNPNLKAGHEAQAIINEVVGANRSQLQGYTEVAGKAANVMVANPYGITCNGCGFINTPNVTLTTGKPQLDANGNLAALEVTKGSVIVEGQGLDGSNADAVSIVARATEINAGIHAKDLSVTVGANRVGADGSVTPIAGEGAAPSVAVDTGALGGMYANRIHLVSSEKGVGVNLGNLVAKQGDIQLDASGKLTLNNSLSSGALTANAEAVTLGGENKASGQVTLSAKQDATLNKGTLVSDAGVSITAKGNLTTNGTSITVGRDVQLSGATVVTDSNAVAKAGNDIRLQAQDRLSNSGQLTAGNNLTITAKQLDNRGMLAANTTGITTSSLQNGKGAAISGAENLNLSSDSMLNQGVLSAPVLSLSSLQTDNSGLIQGSKALTYSGNRLNNLAGGTLSSDNSFALNLPQLSNNGLITSKAGLTLSGDALTNSGEINAASLFASNAQLNNQQGGLLLADNTLNLQNDTLTNDGQIAAATTHVDASTLNNSGTLQGKQSLQASGKAITSSGTLLSDGKLTVSADTLTNRGQLQGQQLAVTADNWHNSGNALSASDGVINAATLDNSGKILGQHSLQLKTDSVDNSGWLLAQALTLQGDLVNSGLIQGSDALTVMGDKLSNKTSGQLLSAGTLIAHADSLDNQGSVQADTLDMRLQSWQNAGSAQATTQFLGTLSGALDNRGTLLSQNDFALISHDITNSGTLAANRISITAPLLTNAGLLQGNSALLLNSADITNATRGQLISGGSLTLSPVKLTNAGLLQVADDFSINGRDLNNSGRITATNLNADLSGTLNNGGQGVLLAQRQAHIHASELNNGGSIAAQQLNASGDVLKNQSLLQGDNGLSADFRQFSNLGAGQLLSNGIVALKGATGDNAGVWQGQSIDYQFGSLSNSGTVYGIDSLKGQSDGLLDNRGSLTAGGNASLTAGNLQNSGKVLADRLVLRGSSLSNSGLWQGTSSLDAQSSGALTQATGGKTLTGGDLLLNAADLNTAGAIQGDNAQINAGRWQNQGSLLGTTGVSADVAGELRNSGEILSQGAAQVSAQNLNNSGSLLADKAMTLSGGALNNSGSVQGETLAITPASVTNQGSLIGLQSLTIGPAQTRVFRMLALQSQPTRELINNAGGQLLTQGTLNIAGDVITNNGSWQGQQILLNATHLANNGAIQSAGDLTLNLSDALTSASGSKITANGNAALNALSFTNQGQWIARNLTLQGATLNNGGEMSGVEGLTTTLSGALTQQQNAALLSGGTLDVHAATVDNAGRMQGKNLLLSSGSVTNSGRLQGDNNLQLNAGGRLTNNASGTLLSQNGLTLTTPELYNYGVIQGATSRITTSGLANNSGKVLSSADLTLSAPQLVNSGWLQASQLVLNAASASNSGTLMADQQATLTGTSLQNQGIAQGGNLTVNYAQLSNNGTVLGVNQLNVKATNVTQQAAGKLFTGGNLLLESTGFDQLGQVVALDDATLKLINSFTARNTLAAGNRLTISSNGAIENQGTLQGQALTLSAGGDLTNNGQLTTGTGDSSLSGQRINMNSAGTLQGGGNVALTSRSDVALNGFTGTRGNLTLSSPGSIVNTALLYAGQNLYLYANSIKNQRGDMLAGNSVWMQRDAAGNANGEVINTSGTIESQNGDITIKTGHLLNQWASLTVGPTQREDFEENYAFFSGTNIFGIHGAQGVYALPLNIFGADELKYFYQKAPGMDYYSVAPLPVNLDQNKEVLISRIIFSTQVTGQAGRISAGRNFYGQLGRVDNLGSYILAGKDMHMDGVELNNQSYLSGTQNVWRSYTPIKNYYLVYEEIKPSDYTFLSPEYDSSSSSYNGLPVKFDDKIYSFATDSYRTEQGSTIHGVIQSNGNLQTNFTNILNNSDSSDVRGTITPLLKNPRIDLLSTQSVSKGLESLALIDAGSVVPGSPSWTDQLTDALQAVNGGNSLYTQSQKATGLQSLAGIGEKFKEIQVTKKLEDSPYSTIAQKENLTNRTSVDIQAYPIPQSTNGYFNVSADPKSPYLIVVNPKLAGLGELDKGIFSELNQLLGKQPQQSPLETSPIYTDKQTFLGSTYLLDRLGMKPESDYRLLGDAAFDTRYVSNAVLSQTGKQYIDGLGSDLEQMTYLMDNAAEAGQSLGLKAGVSLSAEQIGSLHKSILWWEAATVNGETVLVPKLYLVASDTEVNNGSVIAGNTVSIVGQNIENNSSTLSATNKLYVSSKTKIGNQNSSLIKSGGELNLSALGDINNIGSSISGKKVTLESIEGNVNNITLMKDIDYSSQFVLSRFTEQEERANIYSSGDLLINAGNNINIKGASVRADENASLNAAKNLNIMANHNMAVLKDSWQNFSLKSGSGSNVDVSGEIHLQAGKDLTIEASTLSAEQDATLIAGGNVNLLSGQEETHTSRTSRNSYSTGTRQDTLSSSNNLNVFAGNDITSQAAILAAGKNITLSAGRDIDLNANSQSEGTESHYRRQTVISDTVRQSGTTLSAGENISLNAKRDINIVAGDVSAKRDIALNAGADVNLTTAGESDYFYKEQTKTRYDHLSRIKTKTIQEDSATNEKGTLLSGLNVSVSADKDLLVKGSQIVADDKLTLDAGDSVSILAATNTDTAWRYSESKKIGISGSGGLGITLGSSHSMNEMREKGATQSQSISTIGSIGGDVLIRAGDKLQIAGADVVAGNNITLQGDSVSILPGHDIRQIDERSEQRSSGLTLALSGAVAEAANSAIAATQSARQESDGRLAALQATKAVLSGVQASQANQLSQEQGNPANGIGISLSYSTQHSKSEQQQKTDTITGTTINAGNNLVINATGERNHSGSGDLLIAGGQLKAAGDTTLQAANDIQLIAAENTQQTTGKNSSSGGGVGVSIGVGSGSAGISIFASVNGAKGSEKGSGTFWSETTLDSGGDVSIISGRDTLLSGAQVNGNSVNANIGRDLTITSLQDSDKYDSKQASFGAGGSFTFGSMTGSGYINASQDNMHSNYDSVLEQSGIYAGTGGFNITVGNHTQLNGAVIASQADAAKNLLDTGTLGFSDIQNKANYKTGHQGAGISSGGSMGGQFAGNMANTLLAGAGGKGHAEGTTQSAVAEGTIVVRDQANQQQSMSDLSRDTEHANDSISPILNKEKEQKRLQTAQMVGEIGVQVGDIARTQGQIIATREANEKMSSLSASDLAKAKSDWEKANLGKTAGNDDIAKQAWQNNYDAAFNATKLGTGSAVQQGIQAVTAAMQGLAGNNIGQAISGASAPYLAEQIHKYTSGNPEAQAMAHAVVGAIASYASGHDALAGAAGAVSGELMAQIVMGQLYPGKTVDGLTETEKQTISALSTLASGLVGATIGGNTSQAVNAAQLGKNSAENNALYAADDKVRQDAKWSLPYLEGEKKQQAEKLIIDLNAKDKAFDAALDSACKNLTSSACHGMRQELAVMGRSYDEKLDGQYIGNMGTVYKDGKVQVDTLIWQYASADAKAEREADVNRIAKNWGISKEIADGLYTAMAGVHTVAAIGGAAYGLKGAKESSVAAKDTASLVEAEKTALDKIGQNGKNAVDLSGKPQGSILQQQAKNKINDLALQFNNLSVQPKDFKITVNGKTMSADPETSIGAPVFKGASDADVMTYFKQITGSGNMPDGKNIAGKGTVYSIKITEGPNAGSTMTLRDFSNSSQQTGAKWTIDILTPSINNGRRVEVKFK
ncbi:hemagglutinin repeat-containing protein (plasmid) [Enterobacter ludwigii]